MQLGFLLLHFFFLSLEKDQVTNKKEEMKTQSYFPPLVFLFFHFPSSAYKEETEPASVQEVPGVLSLRRFCTESRLLSCWCASHAAEVVALALLGPEEELWHCRARLHATQFSVPQRRSQNMEEAQTF